MRKQGSADSRKGRGLGDERGSVTFFTAASMFTLLLVAGLCIDVSRIYTVRAEVQNAADAAALTAVRELDSSEVGIGKAVTRATAIANTYEFQKNSVSVLSSNVLFSTSKNGPFVSEAAAKLDAGNIKFVQVTTEAVPVGILFAASALTDTFNVVGTSVAGFSISINGICDYFPIAVAKTDPTTLFPTGAANQITLKFKDGTGTGVTLANGDYVVLDTLKQGNGAQETKLTVAGVTAACTELGESIPFAKTPSANGTNGPSQMEDGTNTRFDIYPGGNTLTYENAPPDPNIMENIVYDPGYKENTTTTPPATGHTAKDKRRILVMPLIQAQDYTGTSPAGTVVKFQAFLIVKRVPKAKSCNKLPNDCGNVTVEPLDEALILPRGYYDPTNPATTNFYVPVLYK